MRPIAAVLVVSALALTGCGSDEQPTPVTTGTSGLIDALCAAQGAARAGDIAGTRTIFFDRAHQRLHDLAAQLSDDDRGREARLLEAKQRVEADLSADAQADLPGDVDDLVTATADAFETTGETRPAPCAP